MSDVLKKHHGETVVVTLHVNTSHNRVTGLLKDSDSQVIVLEHDAKDDWIIPLTSILHIEKARTV